MKTKCTLVLLLATGCMVAQSVQQANEKWYSKVGGTNKNARAVNATDDVQHEFVPSAVLNRLISKEIETYYSASNDVSLRRYFASLQSADGSVYIGGNFQKHLADDYLKFVFSGGLKALAKENFATVYKDGEFSPQLGAELKMNYFFNGFVSFTEPITDPCYTSLLDAEDGSGECEDKEEKADKLVAMLQKRKAYSYLFTHWVTVGGYVPFTSKRYFVAADIASSSYDRKENYNWKAYASYTAFWKRSSFGKIYLIGGAEIFNDDNLSYQDPVEFQEIVAQDGSHQAIVSTDDVYVGEYRQDLTKLVKAEAIFFPLGWIGMSAMVKRSFGDFSSTDWKLGVPVSFSDSKGDPTVNFELQWKETRAKHVIGIAIGVVF